ncbi:MAG: PAS domain-containing protein [Deltaproteobacteria bacterium]|nr:PAS domain-containing protein [Deltaproteobacteria bacterium]
MRLDLRAKFVLISLGLVAGVVVAIGLMLEAELAPTEEHADVIRVILIAAGAGGAVLGVLASWLAVTFVRRTLARLSHQIERGGAPGDAAFPEGILADLATTYRRLASDLVRVDSSLAEEHSRFDAVLRSIDAGVFAVDATGRITVTNPAFLELLDLSDPPIGKLYKEVVRAPALHDAVDEALAGRSARVEVRLEHGNERKILVAHASPQGAGAAVFVRDVTSIRQLERVRRDFVANISHELRTPVSVIRASAETLLAGALHEPEHARTFVEAIERHASRMGSIITGLLDLARLEAGQQSLAKEPVNLHAAVQRALDLVDSQVQAKRLRIHNDIPAETMAWADQKGIDQVVSNLLENAVKYADPDGEVWLTAEPAKGWVRLAVADDGPGIAPEHRQRVFERFYRVDKGRSRETGGTGLGLAIVKHLTVAMGGTVGVEGREPRGSIFWVRLPAGRETPTVLA